MDFDQLKELFKDLGFCETALVSLDGPAGQTLREEGFQAAVMAALPYPCDEITDLSTPDDPHTLLAPFARANYYADAVARLQIAAGKIREEGNFKKRDFRIFVNSRLPEKTLALEAGIGFQGKNSLILVPTRGSLVVLAGIALPYQPSGKTLPRNKTESCGTCRRCVEACPTGAILPEGGLIRDRCLQEMSTGKMPENFWKIWETRLYGCQICQDVCPYNRNPLREKTPAPGRLGPSVSIRKILRSGTNLKQLFRGTVLDRQWITPEHLLRNCLLAAGNHPCGGAVREEIEIYLDHSEEMISRAARWSLNRF